MLERSLIGERNDSLACGALMNGLDCVKSEVNKVKKSELLRCIKA